MALMALACALLVGVWMAEPPPAAPAHWPEPSTAGADRALCRLIDRPAALAEAARSGRADYALSMLATQYADLLDPGARVQLDRECRRLDAR